MRGRHSKALVAALTVFAFLGAATAIADAPPSLTIKDPSAVKYASAHLSGTVDPEGGPSSTFWHFDYREASLPEEEASWTQAGFDQEVPAETEGSPTGVTDVAEDFGGFKPGTEYLVRLVASNEDGANRVVSGSKALSTDAVAKPEAKEVEVSGVTTNSAHFKGVVNSGGSGEGEAAGSYRFECEPGCGGTGSEHEFGAEGFADGNDHAVEAEASGLAPNTLYKVKLFARNAQTDAEGQAVVDEVEFTTSPVAPEVFTATNTPEAGAKVTVRGFLNPRNAITECHFDYGPAESYGQSAPCEGSLPSGSDTVLADATLSGLTPGATYHYRVVAESAGGPAQGEDATFTVLEPAPPEGACVNDAWREEQHATELPDCRAWEMVSPPKKNGGDVMASAARTRAAVDGDAVGFSSLQAFGDVKGTSVASEYMAVREGTSTGQGWATHSIFPRLEPTSFNVLGASQETVYQGEFSSDLSKGVLSAFTPLTPDLNVKNVANLYLRQDLLTPGSDSTQLLSPCPLCDEKEPPAPLSDPGGFSDLKVADVTADLGQVIFETGRQLTADAAEQTDEGCLLFGFCTPQLYEFDHGILRFVGLIPPADEIECGGSGPACQAAQVSIAGISAKRFNFTLNTISADGSEVFFTDPTGVNALEMGKLYVRHDHVTTTQLNASERTPCLTEPESCAEESQPARYQIASADGSRVFFTTPQQLTDGQCGSGFYVYDTTLPASDPHNLTCISFRGEEVAALGVSDDGSYLYFVATGTIISGQPQAPESAAEGVYVWHDGLVSLVGFVDGNAATFNRVGKRWNIGGLQSRVTPDGRSLLFTAYGGGGLTGYDHGSCLSNAEKCAELYLYTAPNESLICVSCNPSGATATVDAGFTSDLGSGGSGPTSHLNHPLSENGEHVFFETAERLLSGDTNSRSDVYEFNTIEGGLGLVSSGTGSSDAHFLDASPDGADVFFTTNQRLLGWDSDGNYDLYDARVGGGFLEPPSAPAPCGGDSCRNAIAAPSASSPSSQIFSGIGNPRRQRKHHAHKNKRSHKKHKRAGRSRGGDG